MKACPLCLVECTDDYDYCPIDGIKLLPFVVVSGEDEGRDERERRDDAPSAAMAW